MISKKKRTTSSKKSAKKSKPRAKKAPKVDDTKRPSIRVLIADDHSVVREGLVSLITRKTDMTVSGETLSDREIDVLKLMAQGKSNKEIGSALFISEGTVKSHVKAIFAKMNVISRTEAVANATRRGLIQL